MTIQDVAGLLKVSKATVRAWIENEEPGAVKLECEFRSAKVDLERFVEARATFAIPKTGFAAETNATKGDVQADFFMACSF